MRTHLLARDDGFTLSEMLVVLALMGLVLAGAWALFHLASMGVTQSNQQSWLSREIGQPLENAERMFSQQAPPLQVVGPYLCRLRTDQDRDNLYEVHVLQATADGRLIEDYYEELASAATSPTVDVRKWSVNNVNQSSGTPLFRYFDINGNDISGQSAADIKKKTASVLVTIVSEHEGKRYTDSRKVFFRNR